MILVFTFLFLPFSAFTNICKNRCQSVKWQWSLSHLKNSLLQMTWDDVFLSVFLIIYCFFRRIAFSESLSFFLCWIIAKLYIIKCWFILTRVMSSYATRERRRGVMNGIVHGHVRRRRNKRNSKRIMKGIAMSQNKNNR